MTTNRIKHITSTFAFTAGVALLTAAAHAAEVTENWTKHCVSCHGKDGKAQTKAGRMAGAKDLTDPKQQQSTDEQMFTRIKEGMKDAKGKELMKPFADKLSDEEIKALVAYVRGLKK